MCVAKTQIMEITAASWTELWVMSERGGTGKEISTRLRWNVKTLISVILTGSWHSHVRIRTRLCCETRWKLLFAARARFWYGFNRNKSSVLFSYCWWASWKDQKIWEKQAVKCAISSFIQFPLQMPQSWLSRQRLSWSPAKHLSPRALWSANGEMSWLRSTATLVTAALCFTLHRESSNSSLSGNWFST